MGVIIAGVPVRAIRATAPKIYVDANATGADNGTDWTNAYVYLQDALDFSNANGTTDYEIWVAQGVYYPDLDSDGDHTDGVREEAFQIMHDNVQIYGGFVGTEIRRSQRDWESNLTILSGDIDNNDPNGDGNYIAEDWSVIDRLNAFHVFIIDGATVEAISSDTVLDGFVITAGGAYDTGLTGHESRGGGLVCFAVSGDCSPDLKNLRIQGNDAAATGGGLAVVTDADGMSNLHIKNSSIIGNRGYEGGGIGIEILSSTNWSYPVLVNLRFWNNYAINSGGGLFINSYYGKGQPAVANAVFADNEADSRGGGLYLNADYSPAINNVTLSNLTVANNIASLGGGISNRMYMGGSLYVNIENSILWGNTASTDGDSVYNETMGPDIDHSDVQGCGGSGSWDGNCGNDKGGNIDLDPLYVNPAGYNYSLQDISLAINAGDQTLLPYDPVDLDEDSTTFEQLPLDLALNMRVVNSDVDMGAYEYGPLPWEDSIGMYSRGQKTWYLKDANNDGWGNVATVRFGSTDSSWIPVTGDWDGNNADTIGIYSRGQKTWYLKDANTDGWENVSTVRFGSTDSSWIPVVGDWNGYGMDTIGMYSQSQKTWYLKDTNTDGWSDVSTVRFGSTDSSWIPVVGDWNGNGTDTIGMYSRTQKTWYLKGGNTDGWGDVSTIRFGSTDSSWMPVAGDWDGNGTDTIGMYSRTQKTWYLKGGNTDGWGDVSTVRFGSTDTSWVPVTGTW